MGATTRIRGGRVLVGQELVAADLVVEGETIVAVVAPDHPAASDVTVDATGRLVLPGIIDTHGHTRVPGYEHKEDYRSASEAAAVGGITTMIDMPNVEPPTDSVPRLEEKRAIAAANSIVDWGHWVAPTKVSEIEKLAKAGATGFKLFQVSGAYPHDPRLAVNDDGELLTIMRAVQRTGLPLLIHPFNQSLFERLSSEAFEAGKPRNWLTFSEVYTTDEIWKSAVASLISLQKLSGVRLHLVHTHSHGSLQLIRAAKADGQSITCSVDPKYYLLNRGDLDRLHGRACPGGFIAEDPVRMDEIWRALNDGTLDSIDADHAPHTLEELEQMEVDAWSSAMGSPQYDWLYSIVLNDVHRGRLSLSRAIELLCASPARMLGIFPRKGSLTPGSDADIVIADFDREVVIEDGDSLKTKVKWSPYTGRTLRGYIELTMLRGEVIAKDRTIVGRPGRARYVAGRPSD